MQFLQSVYLYELLKWHKKFIAILFQKGAQIPKFRIFEMYIEFVFFIQFWLLMDCVESLW